MVHADVNDVVLENDVQAKGTANPAPSMSGLRRTPVAHNLYEQTRRERRWPVAAAWG